MKVVKIYEIDTYEVSTISFFGTILDNIPILNETLDTITIAIPKTTKHAILSDDSIGCYEESTYFKNDVFKIINK